MKRSDRVRLIWLAVLVALVGLELELARHLEHATSGGRPRGRPSRVALICANIDTAGVWLRLVSKSVGADALELELVAEGPHQVASGMWLERLAEQLRAGDRVRVYLTLERAGKSSPR